MNTARTIILVAALAYCLYKILNRRKAPAGFLTIYDGRFNRLILHPGITKENFDAFMTEYRNEQYQQHYNLFHRLSGILPDPPSSMSLLDYFRQLNRSQRIYFVLLQMDGQINNGGVYQFLWNQPEMMYAASEALHELHIEPLDKDFAAVVKELEQNAANYARDKEIWNDPTQPYEVRNAAYLKGQSYIPTGAEIGTYFYSDVFAQYFHGKIVQYIHQHRTSFGIPK